MCMQAVGWVHARVHVLVRHEPPLYRLRSGTPIYSDFIHVWVEMKSNRRCTSSNSRYYDELNTG